MGLNLAFFGSSLVSSRWNGAATYYRGILRALYDRGHRSVFYEPNAYERQQHRDLDDPEWSRVVVYEGEDGARRCLDDAAQADVLVKASGVGVFDEQLEAGVLERRRPHQLVVFWDVDAPATLERVENDESDPFARLIPRYDMVLTYGGGRPVVERYLALGARACVPVYNGLDPATHCPAPPAERFASELSFLANRLPDREARADEFFFAVAERRPGRRFVLGGSGWQDKPKPENVNYLGHVFTHDHNVFNTSAGAVLNVSRDSMARAGYSPATRVFEAAGAGACIISDAWEGIDHFFEPGREILVADSGDAVNDLLNRFDDRARRRIGEAAHRRVIAQHTYAGRALDVERALGVTERAASA
jgi:spore maturation protein CgeB